MLIVEVCGYSDIFGVPVAGNELALTFDIAAVFDLDLRLRRYVLGHRDPRLLRFPKGGEVRVSYFGASQQHGQPRRLANRRSAHVCESSLNLPARHDGGLLEPTDLLGDPSLLRAHTVTG